MKGKSKKFLSSMTAMLCVLAILISGTLAWYAASSAVNAFEGKEKETNPGANLHDDFDDPSAGGLVEKNVFVENIGDTDVFVRIRLSELLDEVGYKVYLPVFNEETGDFEGGQYPGFDWGVGYDGEYEYASIKANAAEWNAMTENEQYGAIADALGHADADVGEIVDLTGAAKNKKTQTAEVISIKEYTSKSAKEKEDFIGWVYDLDGYAYWSQPLGEGDATGLLLNDVTVPEAGERTYTYKIKVEMEYVDIKDIGSWLVGGTKISEGPNKGDTTDEASEAAKELLRGIASMGLTAAGGDIVLAPNASKDAPTVTDQNGKPVAIVKWSSDNETVVKVGANGKVTATDKEGIVTITGEDAYGNKVQYKVEVKAGKPENVIEHPDNPGEYWQDNGDNTYTKVNPEDSYKPDKDETVWGGLDGNLGGPDDEPAIYGEDDVRYVDNGKNTYLPVINDDSDPNHGQLDTDNPTTGGHDKKPGNADDHDGSTEPKLIQDGDNGEWYLEYTDGTFDGYGPDGLIDTEDDEKGLTKITPEMEAETPPASEFDENGDGYLNPDEKEEWEDAVEGGKPLTEEQLEAILKDKLTTNLIENGFDPDPESSEQCVNIGNDDGKHANYERISVVPYFAVETDENITIGNQALGEPGKTFGHIEFTEFVKNPADLASGAIKFTMEYPAMVDLVRDIYIPGIKSAQVGTDSLSIYYLPAYDELKNNGGVPGYRPEFTVTATYTNPDKPEETISRDFVIRLQYMGAIDGM